MHEFGIAEAIVDAVERRANGRRVRRARVRAGVLLRIAGPAMDHAFAMVSEGTVAEGAELDLVTEPVRVTCRTCGHSTTSDDAFAVCHECGGTDIDTEGGDRLVLESIQIAEASHVPGHPRRDRGDPAGPY
ncbi:hydrogenase maturation nickel metallochaperone HypA [Planotetraspora sp. GP83]|uniref:hydrogenase maturation nickel metallochaperone HypA/HybF n=1 Tax=Planotetraspora sp. GP83 TaxID=3156264 RepID=UPI0035149743